MMTRKQTTITLLIVGLILLAAGLAIGYLLPVTPSIGNTNCGTAFQPHTGFGVANIYSCMNARSARMPLAITPLILGGLTLAGAMLLTLTTHKE